MPAVAPCASMRSPTAKIENLQISRLLCLILKADDVVGSLSERRTTEYRSFVHATALLVKVSVKYNGQGAICQCRYI